MSDYWHPRTYIEYVEASVVANFPGNLPIDPLPKNMNEAQRFAYRACIDTYRSTALEGFGTMVAPEQVARKMKEWSSADLRRRLPENIIEQSIALAWDEHCRWVRYWLDIAGEEPPTPGCYFRTGEPLPFPTWAAHIGYQPAAPARPTRRRRSTGGDSWL
ncbi:MAG TPA: hypothetical protein VG326_12220 [Tepidisphaeraceae bacterium]|jgi:hypothetical protein|nr:hypothetical protein [Tepidisphaeraceae bacterium]